MRKKAIAIFFTIFFSVYALLNFYIYERGYSCLSDDKSKFIFNIIFSVLSLSFPFGKFLERTHMFRVSRPVSWLSSFWIGAILYFLLIILCIDIIRLADYFIGFLPSKLYFSCSNTKGILFFTSVFIVVVLQIAGFINARIPVIRKLNLDINKKAGKYKSLRVVAVSDIHLGILFGRKRTETLADKIKKLNPDMVLFVGDIIDEVPRPVIELDMGAAFRKLDIPLGKYAVTGNHEFIGGIMKSSAYIASIGIRLLRDECIGIENSFYIVGRDDKDSRWQTGKDRKKLEDILAHVNKDLPIILMDHQPLHLEDAEKNGVDFQLSGHTHHGQLWPINYITNAIFELSHGYIKKGNTYYYVSNGYGAWGPQLRIGNRPEILDITLNFI
ncbi:MAG TPA: metallophosphoesterase [Bacteroidales bacterium]|nr:metallophosphoesterase [Bacteroidales bacterium]HPS17523.1 metallophosphoesterase [Bacteroidales bacterium]